MIGKLSSVMKNKPVKPRLFPLPTAADAEKMKSKSSHSSNWNKFHVLGTVTASVKKKKSN